MHRKRFLNGFTLVELLVVIGIIAVLISILLPALNRAREQANLVQCSSNLRQIGMMLGEYSAENKGYFPYGEVQANPNGRTYPPPAYQDPRTYAGALASCWWYWPDTLTLMTSNRTMSTIVTGGTKQNYVMNAYQYLDVFHDTDVPSMPLVGPQVTHFGVCHYCANCRVLANGMMADPAANPVLYPQSYAHQCYALRTASSIKLGAQVMMVWCAATDVADGATDRGADPMPYALDESQDDWGHGFSNPPAIPASFGSPSNLSNLISLGNDGGPCSASPGGVTLAQLKSQNMDYWNAASWDNTADMRFRHMDNTMANALFVDGHVESSLIGSVRALDICLNPINHFDNNYYTQH
ncbi:MAG: type II secretion system protein [Tepidisphaeraceae bacterium]